MKTMNIASILAAAILSLAATTGSAQDAAGGNFDWDIWARLAVQEGGRMKPFETQAAETIVQLTASAKPTPGNPWSVSAADILAFSMPAGADAKAWSAVRGLLTAPTIARLDAAEALVRTGKTATQNAAELRRQLKKFEGDYVAEHSVQPNAAQLTAYVASPSFKAKHGDAGAKIVEQINAIEKERDAVDAAKAAFVREINELLPTAELFTALGSASSGGPPGGKPATPIELMEWNRKALARNFPGMFKPLELAGISSGFELRKYRPIELYLRLLMGWQGWDKVKSVEQLQSAGPNADDAYWGFHQPDVWDSAPLINARFEAMGPKLKPETRTAVSVRGIAGNQEFRDWARELIGKSNDKEESLTPVEEKALAVVRDYQLYMNVRTGINLICGPNQTAKTQDWAPLFAVLMLTPEQTTGAGFTPADVDDLKAGFHAARQGLLANDAAKFNAGSRRFADALERMGRNSHIYPSKAAIDREIHYNRTQPFLWTTGFATVAAALLLVSLGTGGGASFLAGFVALLTSMGTMVYGSWLRIAIAGRPPVTNMYETIMWSSFVAAALAVVLGLVYRQQRVIPLTAAVVLSLSTLLANFMPLEMGSSITPLQPVLRSNYWLIVHVMTIVGSYGAFMLAWGLGNVGLGYYLVGKGDSPAIKPMAMFCYRAIQVGVLMLAAGTILGGWWAAESWGRFWGWDPKEVWALIALIGYLMILHCRFVGWVRLFGTLAGAVIAFTLVVMAWYGVNFVLGAGLHAYAFGTGGLHYVVAAVIANWVFYFAALARHLSARKKARTATTKPNAEAERAPEFADRATTNQFALTE